MTKQEFMKVTGFDSESELEAQMLLAGDEPPANGDYTEMMHKWYSEIAGMMRHYMDAYHALRYSKYERSERPAPKRPAINEREETKA